MGKKGRTVLASGRRNQSRSMAKQTRMVTLKHALMQMNQCPNSHALYIEAVYDSGAAFFRWNILRVRDLLRGFFSFFFSPLAVRPRPRRPLGSSSPMYLSL